MDDKHTNYSSVTEKVTAMTRNIRMINDRGCIWSEVKMRLRQLLNREPDNVFTHPPSHSPITSSSASLNKKLQKLQLAWLPGVTGVTWVTWVTWFTLGHG